jgi:hypothetical protein
MEGPQIQDRTSKDPAAVALGRKGGLKGGPARAKKLGQEEAERDREEDGKGTVEEVVSSSVGGLSRNSTNEPELCQERPRRGSQASGRRSSVGRLAGES